MTSLCLIHATLLRYNPFFTLALLALMIVRGQTLEIVIHFLLWDCTHIRSQNFIFTHLQSIELMVSIPTYEITKRSLGNGKISVTFVIQFALEIHYLHTDGKGNFATLAVLKERVKDKLLTSKSFCIIAVKKAEGMHGFCK
jgi:hypothetical protein